MNQPRNQHDLHIDNIPGVNVQQAILGRLGELVLPKDPKWTRALSSILGPKKLRSIIATDDRTVQTILESGRLRDREQFFPLTKVEARPIDGALVNRAKDLAKQMGGFAMLGSELVEPTDERLGRVIVRYFGGFMVCSDLQVARKIAFDPSVRMKAVTLDGDSVDPVGSVTGGAVAQMRDVLAEMSSGAANRMESRKMRAEIGTLESEERKLREFIASGQRQKQACDEAMVRVQLLRQKSQLNGGDDTADKLQRLEATKEAQMKQSQELSDALTRYEARLEAVKQELAQKDDAQHEKELKARLKDAEARLKKLAQEVQQGASSFEDTDAKKAELEQKVDDIANDIKENESELKTAQEELAALKATKDTQLAKLKECETRIQEEDAKANQLQEEHDELRADRDGLKGKEDLLNKTIKDNDHELRNKEKEITEARHTIADLKRLHPWLEEEKDSFGNPEGPYFFQDAERTKAALDKLEEANRLNDVKAKTINKKAPMLYEQSKKEYDELVLRRNQLEEDRKLIVDSIQRVEERKWTCLDAMVRTVSVQFSTLFAACLPGASCRLVEERDQETGHLCGLQVRVAFNGKEKESLTELSGGQRSLLALCLILAILKFRPAPVYILDEVDAALDPSHTQNIGIMLKKHFADAQFLLVSLKDGMYSSANVVYQVRNEQGFSEVTRTVMKTK